MLPDEMFAVRANTSATRVACEPLSPNELSARAVISAALAASTCAAFASSSTPREADIVSSTDTPARANSNMASAAVRAVTPGSYVHPAAQIEDMYQPGILARTGTGTVAVLPTR